MKISLLADQNQLLLYRDKQGVLLYTLLLAMVCLGFGAAFVLLPSKGWLIAGADEQWVLPAVGLLFLLPGAWALRARWQLHRKMADQPGYVLLQAGAAGLVMTPALNAQATTCSWAHIARIVVTDAFNSLDGDECGYSGSRVLIYLREDSPAAQLGLVEHANRQLSRSLTGELLAAVPCAAGLRAQIVAGLQQFAPAGIPIASCQCVLFDYRKGIELLED
ncbi:hypothetical protein IGB42_01858 [Andreprevotia sp. IGB-42]|uniref:hypothetical protein n=1 Tax=Andreprevotia sp. IGB-42 TaxID=2497473 RepID=UPI00135699B0|nr:hypothetical protein [Andreprevotia sp. IGB-42]KAF0813507.1 hypothetical protein IGB42_01858 [Andreprevotia sp. IGB-42]